VGILFNIAAFYAAGSREAAFAEEFIVNKGRVIHAGGPEARH